MKGLKKEDFDVDLCEEVTKKELEQKRVENNSDLLCKEGLDGHEDIREIAWISI